MPSYSHRSQMELSTCEDALQRLFSEVIKHYDCTIIQGYRPLDEQELMFQRGLSRIRQGKHNVSPSQAVDVGPYFPDRHIPWPQVPHDWTDKDQRNHYIKDLNQWYHFIGYVEGIAYKMGISIRSGADWDRDHDITDQSFNDLVHYELV